MISKMIAGKVSLIEDIRLHNHCHCLITSCLFLLRSAVQCLFEFLKRNKFSISLAHLNTLCRVLISPYEYHFSRLSPELEQYGKNYSLHLTITSDEGGPLKFIKLI